MGRRPLAAEYGREKGAISSEKGEKAANPH